VHVQVAPVIEMQKLMLASALDALDARAPHRTNEAWGEAPAERGVQEAESLDRTSARHTLEQPACGFDLRKLRHGRAKD
jgi:hypothetical protein